MGFAGTIEHVRADRFGHMLAQRDAQDGGGIGEKPKGRFSSRTITHFEVVLSTALSFSGKG